MSDQIALKPGETAPAAIDITKYVPKDDFEKLTTDSKTAVEKLRGELDQAKLSLLDPEYIAYLEKKKSPAATAASAIKDEDIAKMTSKQILDLAVDRVRDELLPQYEQKIGRLNATLSDVLAMLELQEVMKAHDDFETYRDKTKEILESSPTPLTIEQAYLLAKVGSIKPTEETDDEKGRKVKSGTEKPSGTIPRETITPKSFGKDKNAAANDAWDTVVGKGKETL